jgi:hypothetical protein
VTLVARTHHPLYGGAMTERTRTIDLEEFDQGWLADPIPEGDGH